MNLHDLNLKTLQDEKAWYEFFSGLSGEEQQALSAAVANAPKIGPLPGPQTDAFLSKAKYVLFGGKAGGGKSGCSILKILQQHQRCLILRRHKDDLSGFIDDLIDKYGTDKGLNRQDKTFYFADRPGHKMDYGGCGGPGEENSWNGNPHDLIVFEEVDQISREKVEHISGWNRSTDPNQFCQVFMTCNPPETTEGMWIIDFFAPWVDPNHPDYPAPPGQLRYFMRDPETDEDIEVPDGEPRNVIIDGKADVIIPESRTFIPASLEDNPYLARTGYANHLKNRPKHIRDRLYVGKFVSQVKDPIEQVIPSAWIDDAQGRWEPRPDNTPLDALGVDVARGGQAVTVFAPRKGLWWDKLVKHPGVDTPRGNITAGLIRPIMEPWPDSLCCLDTLGPGSSVEDFLVDFVKVEKVVSNVQLGLPIIDPNLQFYNLRALLWWFMRMILDPSYGLLPSLPRDKELKRELATPRYMEKGRKIIVETKREIRARLNGKSTDAADAVIYTTKPLAYHLMTDPLVARLRPRYQPVRRDRPHRPRSRRHLGRIGWMAN